MEAHKDSNKRALGLHYTRQKVITHTDKCGAASSRPIRTTSTSPPEALLHLTHSSRPQHMHDKKLGGSHKTVSTMRAERVIIRSVVVGRTVTVKPDMGAGLSGSKVQRDLSVNAHSGPFSSLPPFHRFVSCAAEGEGMAGIRVITKATDRIAKFRDAKKMVHASCEAARQASRARLLAILSARPVLSRLLKIHFVIVSR